MSDGPPQGPPTGPPQGPPTGPPSGPPQGPPTGPPTGPPSGPPPGPPPPPAPAPIPPAPVLVPPAPVLTPAPSNARPPWVPFAAIGAVVLLVVAVVVLAGGSDSKKPATHAAASSSSGAPKEVFLEASTSTGTNPFTTNVALGPSSVASSSSSSSTTASAGTVRSVTGTTPGLYGGTRDQSSCDKAAMVSFLEANPVKGRAWADAQGIGQSEIRSFVDGLTPVLLEADTRVTNHGFANGVATPHQSVLQAGTAVLVDDTGVPRARCACGNPLLPPAPSEQNFSGDPWTGFDPGQVVVVAAGPPTVTFIIVDVNTGAPISRPVGTDGSSDHDASSSSSSSSSTASSSAAVDLTSTGAVTASSVAGGSDYPASLAVDGDVTTSWFSGGTNVDGPDSTFTWELPGPGQATIDTVDITGNAANSNPQFQKNFGFESVEVIVVDLSGVKTFDATVDLGGTPDPHVTVRPLQIGHEVVLIFHGHESPDCGGFAELEVIGTPDG